MNFKILILFACLVGLTAAQAQNSPSVVDLIRRALNQSARLLTIEEFLEILISKDTSSVPGLRNEMDKILEEFIDELLKIEYAQQIENAIAPYITNLREDLEKCNDSQFSFCSGMVLTKFGYKLPFIVTSIVKKLAQ